eukprot:24123-Chlamydomonas_euryale.AAC.1
MKGGWWARSIYRRCSQRAFGSDCSVLHGRGWTGWGDVVTYTEECGQAGETRWTAAKGRNGRGLEGRWTAPKGRNGRGLEG